MVPYFGSSSNRVKKMIGIHSSSGDSTIRLWEDSKEDGGADEIKAGSILSHSVLPTEQNEITCLDWSVGFRYVLDSSQMANNLFQLPTMVRSTCGHLRVVNLHPSRNMIVPSSTCHFHRMQSMCWSRELFLRFMFSISRSLQISKIFWILYQ